MFPLLPPCFDFPLLFPSSPPTFPICISSAPGERHSSDTLIQQPYTDTAAIHWYSSGWYSCRIKLSSPMQSPDAAQKQMSASRWLVVAIWVGTGRVHLHTLCIFETSTQPLFAPKHCPTTHLSQQYPWKVVPSLLLTCFARGVNMGEAWQEDGQGEAKKCSNFKMRR